MTTTGERPDTGQVHASSTFHVGQRFRLGSRKVTSGDLARFVEVSGDSHPLHTSPEHARAAGFDGPILHGPFGLALFFGLWHESGLARSSVIAMLDTDWRYHAPISVGDELAADVLITRVRRTSSKRTAVVGRHATLTNQDGVVVQSGSSSFLMHAGTEQDHVGRMFFERPWATALQDRLTEDQTFSAATESWDGTIGLRCRDQICEFRVYRGSVIEAGNRSPLGPTFCLEADEATWATLFTGPANDLTVRLMSSDDFRITGSAYEYLRMTKALMALVDVARSYAAEDVA